MPAPLPLWLLFPPVLALGGGAVRVMVVADDPALGAAVVRSASQHLAGPIILSSKRTPTPVGVLRLQVQRDGADRLQIVLSRGSARARRTLQIRGQPRAFDLAEAVAIALPALRTQLEQQALRQAVPPQRPAPPPPRTREASVVALVVDPVPLPGPAPGPAPSAKEPAQTPAAESAPPATAPAPPGPVASRPAPPPPPPALTRPPPAAMVPGRERPTSAWRWQLGLGVGLTTLGLAAASLGAASLALDGRCADAAVPCEYRYEGRVAGAAELAAGGAAALAGAGLVIAAAVARTARREGRPARALLLPGPGPGLSIAGAF